MHMLTSATAGKQSGLKYYAWVNIPLWWWWQQHCELAHACLGWEVSKWNANTLKPVRTRLVVVATCGVTPQSQEAISCDRDIPHILFHIQMYHAPCTLGQPCVTIEYIVFMSQMHTVYQLSFSTYTFISILIQFHHVPWMYIRTDGLI